MSAIEVTRIIIVRSILFCEIVPARGFFVPARGFSSSLFELKIEEEVGLWTTGPAYKTRIRAY